jgi:hypothetical protein
METFNQYVMENWMLFVLLVVLVGGAVEGLKYIMRYQRESAELQAQTELKKEMIQRGMSADEIARVLFGTAPVATTASGQPIPTNHLAELGKDLAVAEVSAPIMEAVLAHFASIPGEHQPAIYKSLKEMIDSSVAETALLATASSLAKAYSHATA